MTNHPMLADEMEEKTGTEPAAAELTSQGLIEEQMQHLIKDNSGLVEENAKLVEDNMILQSEVRRLKAANEKLMLQLEQCDLSSDTLVVRSQSQRSLTTADGENLGTPRGARRDNFFGSRRSSLSFGSAKQDGPFRPLAIDTERGLQGALGRWRSSSELSSVPPSPSGRSRGPVRGLVLRVGHLQHTVPELEISADSLEKNGFTTRDSLADLTDDSAMELGIPLKLASTLRSEVTTKRLKQRYTGPVQPLQEISPDGAEPPKLQPSEITPQARHHQNSKEPKSKVRMQVLRVGNLLHPPWELEKYAQTLEDHDYLTRESLGSLTDQAAARMRVPLKLAAVLREKAVQERRDGSSTPAGSTPSFALQERGVPHGVPRGPPARQPFKHSPRGHARSATSNGAHGSGAHHGTSSAASPSSAIRNNSPGMIANEQRPGVALFNQSFMPQALQPSAARQVPYGMVQHGALQLQNVAHQSPPSSPPVPAQYVNSRTSQRGQSPPMALTAWPSPRGSLGTSQSQPRLR